jgi:hypothetical protein
VETLKTKIHLVVLEQAVSIKVLTLVFQKLTWNWKSEPIVAKTRKLKAVWTPELAQDLNAYHSIDAEAELTALLSEYVSMEIDLEILDMLITCCSGCNNSSMECQDR